jgi:hypothetical protein
MNKELTNRRATESVTYNDVLRELLGLNPKETTNIDTESASSEGSWTIKGVTFPAGTEFRATYKGQTILGKIENSFLMVNGKRYDSPSAAAVSITDNMVNGWIFWKCRFPGKTDWHIIKALRK